METRNTPEQIELRRRQNTLIIVGAGTILLGVWTVVKYYGILFLNRSKVIAALTEILKEQGAEWKDEYFSVLLFFAGCYLLLLLLIRALVGIGAVLEGRGRHSGILYIVAACLLIWDSLVSVIGMSSDLINQLMGAVAAPQTNALQDDASISSIVIELTSLVLLAEMVYSSIRIKRLTGIGRKHIRNKEDRTSDNAA